MSAIATISIDLCYPFVVKIFPIRMEIYFSFHTKKLHIGNYLVCFVSSLCF